MILISLAHVFLHGPLIASYALTDLTGTKYGYRSIHYYSLITVVVSAFLWHVYRYWNSYTPIRGGNPINLFHIIAVFPVLFYYLVKDKEAVYPVKIMTLAVGVMAILVHLLRLLGIMK